MLANSLPNFSLQTKYVRKAPVLTSFQTLQ